METLLAHSFDYLSSCDQHKIRKGLRQVEGLMAQICLSRSSEPADGKQRHNHNKHHHKNHHQEVDKRQTRNVNVNDYDYDSRPAKSLEQLRDDPAFLEWFKLQNNFQWNVTTHLISCLSTLLSLPPTPQLDILILSTLDVIQGSLLLHPPSRALFAREINMNILLDLLEPANSPQVQSATLFTLVSALMCHPAGTRCFEELDGLLTITSLFKLRATRKEVKVRLVEFLYFYLMPESGMMNRIDNGGGGDDNNNNENGVSSSGGGTGSGRSSKSISARNTRTLEEKKVMLGKYLNNVDDLVADLRETIPFGSG